MNLHAQIPYNLRSKALVCLSALAPFTASSLKAIDLLEDFNGATLDTAVWEPDGTKSAALTAGRLEIADDGGNWARYSIRSEQRFFIPPAGQTSTFEWELAPGTITTDAGQSIRMQMGIISNNEPQSNPEHYPNSTGGIWLDLENIQSTDTANALGNIYYADDTKTGGSNGVNLGGVTVPWNWQTDTKVVRLELTDTDFTWYDGTNILGTSSLAAAGIDNEFGNGFRVIALGMNFDAGRGTTAFERVEVTNGQGPTGLLQSFASSSATVFGGQKFDLTWLMDGTASATIDQGIGNVDAQTSAGSGSTPLIAPDVTVTTPLTYNITVSKTGQPNDTRQVTVNVVPTSELCLVDFSDDFSAGFIDTIDWVERGNNTSSVTGDIITWDNGAIGNWAHGEIDTQKVFPIPPAGSPTTITWVLDIASYNTMYANGDPIDPADTVQSIRPVMGVVSAFANNGWTLQHWQNTEGGLWLDINTMGSGDTTSVSGSIHYADDTKITDMNATTDIGFSVPWNWQTEGQEFSLVLTDTDYTWYAGTDLLGTDTYANAGIDTAAGGEFSKGFRVMFAAVNYNNGRGKISLNSIDVQNGVAAGPAGPPVITDAIDNNDGTMTLTWNSISGADYAIESSTTLLSTDWTSVIGGVTGAGSTTSFSVNTSGDKLFYRVVRQP